MEGSSGGMARDVEFDEFAEFYDASFQRVVGQAHEQMRAYIGMPEPRIDGQSGDAFAAQRTLFYRDAAATQAAWNSLPSNIEACDAHTTASASAGGAIRYSSAQMTAHDGDDAQCWSTLTTYSGSPPPSIGVLIHWCFVRSGDVITVVNLQLGGVGSYATIGFGRSTRS